MRCAAGYAPNASGTNWLLDSLLDDVVITLRSDLWHGEAERLASPGRRYSAPLLA